MNLATDRERLRSLRTHLSEMMSQSALTNAKQFTLDIENCYLMMWKKWCRK